MLAADVKRLVFSCGAEMNNFLKTMCFRKKTIFSIFVSFICGCVCIMLMTHFQTTMYYNMMEMMSVTSSKMAAVRIKKEPMYMYKIRPEAVPNKKWYKDVHWVNARPPGNYRLLMIYNDWQIVDGNIDVRVHSAFLDDRAEMMLRAPGMIRITSVADKAVHRAKLKCRLFYNKTTTDFTDVDVQPIYLGVFDKVAFGVTYGPHVLNCHLPVDRGAEMPTHVGVYAVETKSPTTFLKIETPLKLQTKQRFGLCVSFSHTKVDPYRLVEWVELQRILGVEYIGIHNTSLDATSDKIYKYYQDQGIVDYRSIGWPLGDGQEWSMKQNEKPSINNCYLRNIHRFDYIAVYDTDEFLVPRNSNHTDFRQLFDYLEEKYYQKLYVTSFHVRNSFFWTNPFSEPDVKQPKELATLRYQKRLDFDGTGGNNHWKGVLSPRACALTNNHDCLGVIGPHRYPVMDPKDAALFHYKPCNNNLSKNKCDWKKEKKFVDKTMLKFKDKLIPRVKAAISDLGLKPLTEPKPLTQPKP